MSPEMPTRYALTAPEAPGVLEVPDAIGRSHGMIWADKKGRSWNEANRWRIFPGSLRQALELPSFRAVVEPDAWKNIKKAGLRVVARGTRSDKTRSRARLIPTEQQRLLALAGEIGRPIQVDVSERTGPWPSRTPTGRKPPTTLGMVWRYGTMYSKAMTRKPFGRT